MRIGDALFACGIIAVLAAMFSAHPDAPPEIFGISPLRVAVGGLVVMLVGLLISPRRPQWL